ncbi:MAG: hypothetical protein WEE67_04370 [Chloroflexota bacterium]
MLEPHYPILAPAGKPKDGDPHACWALIETTPADVRVEFRRVAYDIEAAARAIEASHLPDEFAAQLRGARGYRAAPAGAPPSAKPTHLGRAACSVTLSMTLTWSCAADSEGEWGRMSGGC